MGGKLPPGERQVRWKADTTATSTKLAE